jgi:Reverse transcriptase (RNA-dependent DNA polymerase)
VEPLSVIARDDPIMCAIYARDNNLLELEGRRQFKGIANRELKFRRLVNQAKLRSYRLAPRYKYGYEVRRDYKYAMELNIRNGNKLWREATDLELTQLNEYNTFKDLGPQAWAPHGYKKIRAHLVYDVKHNGRHKARMVADGHLMTMPVDSAYSGVISLRGIQMLVFLAELNGLQTWSTKIGNAYLEAEMKEKVFFAAGPKFGNLAGHTLIIVKALYGLRTSRAHWHDRFADCLCDMGFEPSKGEPDIWMRQNGDVYEYILVSIWMTLLS